MSAVNIFICYKKVLLQEKPGKIIEQKNTNAEILHYCLQAFPDHFAPWIDDSKLEAGMEWETEIYKRVLESDVLLVLIAPGTAQSEWVKREIALATALGITIIPLGTDIDGAQMVAEMKVLGIER